MIHQVSQCPTGHERTPVKLDQSRPINTKPSPDTTVIKFEQCNLQNQELAKKADCEPSRLFSEVKSEHSQKKKKKLWTREEDELLLRLIDQWGPMNWKKLSESFDQRCGKQCRERWHNHLRQGIKKGGWTLKEEWQLFLGVHAYGQKWSVICKLLQNRTENSVKNHWNCKMKPRKFRFMTAMNSILRKGYLTTKDCFFSAIQLQLLNIIHNKTARLDQLRTDLPPIQQIKHFLHQFQLTKAACKSQAKEQFQRRNKLHHDFHTNDSQRQQHQSIHLMTFGKRRHDSERMNHSNQAFIQAICNDFQIEQQSCCQRGLESSCSKMEMEMQMENYPKQMDQNSNNDNIQSQINVDPFTQQVYVQKQQHYMQEQEEQQEFQSPSLEMRFQISPENYMVESPKEIIRRREINLESSDQKQIV